MTLNSHCIRTTAWALYGAIFIPACTFHQPDQNPSPAVQAGDRYAESSSSAAPRHSVAEKDAWWREFGDKELNGLTARSLTGNLELQAVTARIEQANALLRQAGARLFPTVDAGGSLEPRWESDGNGGSSTSSIGFLLDWELDVWGRLRAARSAQEKYVTATYEDWQGARLLLTASVADTWFDLVEQRLQLELVSEQEEVNVRLLRLTKIRFGQAQASMVDVLQQQQQLESIQARRPEIEARLKQLQLTLEVLQGAAPGSSSWPESGELAPPPALPATGLPADLLLNRPDLLAARQRVVALDYRVAEAIADRLPRLTLGGALTGAGNAGLESLIASAAASAIGPVFDAGNRQAEVDLRRAELQEAVSLFSHGYLAAVAEVETALVRERKQAETVALLETRLDTAKRLLNETSNRYRQGLTDYLPVLNAVATLQNLEREALTARRLWLSYRVALHRALGGPMPDAEFPPAKTSTSP